MNKSGYVKVVLSLAFAATVLVLISLLYDCYERKIYKREYSAIVEKYSCEYGVSENTIYAVIKTESDFDNKAVSGAGAVGLMQLMPETYGWLVRKAGSEEKDLFDPDENIKYGTYLLSLLYERYKDDDLVFAAYNAGMGNVDKWLSDGEYKIRFAETQNYVNKIKTAREKYEKLYRR